jgi:alpha-glucosidase
VYQVYPRSFADSDGDGIGDLPGIRARLGYLRDLGVDALWVSPWFESPWRDGGYDVTDYRSVHPMFGTLADAERLVTEAAEVGLRVLFDLVPNHTSSEHRWFRAALAAPPGSAARARYHFRDGRGADGDEPPNNWASVFGGPAWTRTADGQWYLHLFDPGQPDLNWANQEVCDEFDDVIRFWLDRGAGGFRTDVAHALTKDTTYPDLVSVADLSQHRASGDEYEHPYFERADAHAHFRRWRTILDSYDHEPIMVAEAWAATSARLATYIRPGEFNQAFNFFFLETPWEATTMVSIIETSLRTAAEVDNVPTWVLSNHDVMRPATRFGLPPDVEQHDWLARGDRDLLDPAAGRRRALAASMLAMALPGSIYLYQGEELGLPEVHDLPAEVLDDPIWRRSGNTMKGRDGCRVPMPWTTRPPDYGFTDGDPWLPVPHGWGELSVEAQAGVEGSPLEIFRRALALRREHLLHADLEWLDGQPDGVIAFRRRRLRCHTNVGTDGVDLPPGEVLHSSGPLFGGRLPPDTTAWSLDA